MPLLTSQELDLLWNHVVMRTERGNDIIKRDPREMPRRLRVLLLAIDGGQPVQLYTQNLKGFGDISELLVELINLGLVRLIEPILAKQASTLAADAHRSEQYTALDSLLDDSRFSSENAADVLYGATAPGSFDEMVRVARIERPEFKPAPAAVAPPAPVAAPEQKAQIESVFSLLDSVRGQRANLRHQLTKLNGIKDIAQQLHLQNQKLQNWVYGLGILSTLLAVALAVVIFWR